jgi:hypothetical protein
MNSGIISNWSPLSRAFYGFLIAIAALWPMPRNVCAQLYVAQNFSGIVGEYDAKTGAAINNSFITGLQGPSGVALSGSTLFVANANNNTVNTYDAKTGAAINATFITALSGLEGIAVKSAK